MSAQIQGLYFGKSKPLFSLYLKTALLTLLTLGIYRFWAKTRIRKYVWSATSGDGDSFEYTGTGLEKFLGFLVAIVILAVYLGIVQMGLFFLGLNLFSAPQTDQEALAQVAAIYITFFAVLPLLLFAQYRARRYKMARTRWRGLRFGMESAAWGFALRALGYFFLVIVTLGVLTPLATFKLEKFMADRSWYGDAKFEQQGRWTAMFRGMKHVLIGIVIMIAGSVIGAVAQIVALSVIGLVVGYVWLLIGLVYYRVWAFNYLTNNKVLDGKVRFSAEASTSKIVAIVVIGTIVIAVALGVFLGIGAGTMFAAMSGLNDGQNLGVSSVIVIALIYVLALLGTGALNLVMITQPIIEHVVTNVSVDGAEHLDSIQQRAADLGADAEGFADALDVGGAI